MSTEPPCYHGPQCSGIGPDCDADEAWCWPRLERHVEPHTSNCPQARNGRPTAPEVVALRSDEIEASERAIESGDLGEPMSTADIREVIRPQDGDAKQASDG